MVNSSTVPQWTSSPSHGPEIELHDFTDHDPQFNHAISINAPAPLTQPPQVIPDGEMESMLCFDVAMAPELQALNDLDWLIEFTSQDLVVLEGLAELFSLDGLDDPSLNQAVTPSEVEPSVDGAPTTHNNIPYDQLGDDFRDDPGSCAAGSESTPGIDLPWDDSWTDGLSFNMESPSSMSIQFLDQRSADVDMLAPCLALTESPFSARHQLKETYPFSLLSMSQIMGSQHDTSVHETDRTSIGSQLKQRPDTSFCDGGVDAAMPPLSRTGVTDDNMRETQAPSLELKLEDQESTDAGTLVSKYDAWEFISNNSTDNHQVTITPTRKNPKRRKASLDPDGSDSPRGKRLCIETFPGPTVHSDGKSAGINTNSSQLRDHIHPLDTMRSCTPKRRNRSPLHKRVEPEFVTLRDIAEPNGNIKGSFPLHIHSLDMYPDPTDSFMLHYRWDRREKVWVTNAPEDGSVSQEVLPDRVMTADQMCGLVDDLPELFKIYLRVGCSMNFVMEWGDSTNSFIIDDPIEWEPFSVSREQVSNSFNALNDSGKRR